MTSALSPDPRQLAVLRRVINENLRVQRAGAAPVPYIDVSSALSDICARQNHAVFARRGCGKTLLLHHSAKELPDDIQAIYLNCEDFKHHSFPNVLIEIMEALFAELEENLPGWFGRKKKSRNLIAGIRRKLKMLRGQEDETRTKVVESHRETEQKGGRLGGTIARKDMDVAAEITRHGGTSSAVELRYAHRTAKLSELHAWLPELKRQIREFFKLSTTVNTIFLQMDDFYHLARKDQPDVMDYLHRALLQATVVEF